jgi:hypothetical protein
VVASDPASSVSASADHTGGDGDAGHQEQSGMYSDTFEEHGSQATKDRSTARSTDMYAYSDSFVAESNATSPTKASSSMNLSSLHEAHVPQSARSTSAGDADHRTQRASDVKTAQGKSSHGSMEGSATAAATAGYEDDFEEMSDALESSIATDFSHEMSVHDDDDFPRVNVDVASSSHNAQAASLLQVFCPHHIVCFRMRTHASECAHMLPNAHACLLYMTCIPSPRFHINETPLIAHPVPRLTPTLFSESEGPIFSCAI